MSCKVILDYLQIRVLKKNFFYECNLEREFKSKTQYPPTSFYPKNGHWKSEIGFQIIWEISSLSI